MCQVILITRKSAINVRTSFNDIHQLIAMILILKLTILFMLILLSKLASQTERANEMKFE